MLIGFAAMDKALSLLAALMALLLAPATSFAQPAGQRIAVELVAEGDAPTMGGTVMLALVMRPAPGWHGYWKNPGDAGVEPRLIWTLPPGVKAGPLQYPVPERLMISGLMNYVYVGDYAQLVALDVPAGLAEGSLLPLRGRFEYLACTDRICVPETAEVALDLRVGTSSATRRAEFDRYREALPRPLGSPATFEVAGGKLRIAIPLPAATEIDEPYFFPLRDRALVYAAPQIVSRSGDRLIVETSVGRDAGSLSTLDGVLRIGDRLGLVLEARPGPVPPAGDPIGASRAPAGAGTILVALGGAILGGLILNVMPCVFPILSLKALSLARAGGDAGEARREALAYTVGVVLTCVALGAALLTLRAGGMAAGWAFQLQDPRVILFLFLLVTAIALNLAGLFDLPALSIGGELAGKGGTAGAFWTGALAAIVATPCTGPFMGAALGAALVLPVAAGLAIFAGLGIGLAIPFLLLGFVPALRARLPRPGPWMRRLQRILSLPMFATALGLFWILGRQAGDSGLAIGLGAVLILGLSLWLVGRRQGGSRAWLPALPAALVAVAALAMVPTSPGGAQARRSALLGAEKFSETRLAALRAEGRPVFVYFTADWCVTCKVNEAGALRSKEVAAAFASANVATLVGDWTRGDAAIGRFLEKQGRSGVPLYLYYRPGRPAETLPQLLTPARLVASTR